MNMKKYKVISPRAVFHVGSEMHVIVKGDVVELSETELTTRVMLERKIIKPFEDKPTKTSGKSTAAKATETTTDVKP